MTPTSPTSVTVRVATAGYSIEVPPDLVHDVEPAEGLSLVAVAAGLRITGFAPNHVITLDNAPDADDGRPATLRDWQVAVDLVHEESLDGYCLIDIEQLEIGGHPGMRRLASYASAEGRSLTMQQWCTIVDHRAYTLTSTVATLDFPFLADELDEFARGWQIDPPQEEQ